MEHLLSNCHHRLNESKTLEMARLARELTQQGKDVINLSIGQPDFPTPVHIKEAAKRAIDQNYTGYTPVPGYPELREAIAEKFKRDNGLHFTPEQIVVSTGAKQSLANIFLAVINAGDEVIIPAPYWVTYPEQVEMAGGKPVVLKSTVESDFKVTAEQVEDCITAKTKMFVFSSPSNPTGSVYTREELRSLAELFSRYPDIIIVSDEIYEYINYEGNHESIAQFDQIKDRVIVVNGLSKGYSMTGWRVGYIGAPKWLASACTKMQGQITSGTCSISQRAAIEALTGDMAPTFKMRDAFRIRRDMVLSLLKEIPGLKVNIPPGAFYFFPDISFYLGRSNGEITINSPDDFCTFLLNKYHVSIVTGTAFGDKNCIRLAYAASEDELVKALERMKTAFEEFL